MRMSMVALLLAASLSCEAAVVLNETFELAEGAPTLRSGEYYRAFTIPVRENDVVVCSCQAEGAAPYLLATTDTGQQFERAGERLTFLAVKDGEASVVATTVEAAETGVFSLQVEVFPLKLGEDEGPSLDLNVAGELGPGDRVLQSGEFADTHEVALSGTVGIAFVSADFDAYMVVARPGEDPIDVDDVSGTDPELTWIGGDEATILVTSAEAGETGSYVLTVLSADLDWQAPALRATPKGLPEVAAPITVDAPPGADAPSMPSIPPAPKLEGSALLDLSEPEWVIEAPAAGQASDLVRRGLHRMNYIEVEIGGQMNCTETNPPYQREWPSRFGWSIDNYLQGAAGGPPIKCPLQWTGDLFTAYGMQPNGEGGHTEMVHVTGRVSADGDRILWVLVRSFEQGAYDDPDTGDRFANYQLWKSLGFVDLPLNNPHWEAWGDERITTMADLMPRLDETLILRDGFTYGWRDYPSAGDHLLEAGYLLREPGAGDRYLVLEDLHSLEYQSTEWQNAENPPTAILRFEYNAKLAP